MDCLDDETLAAWSEGGLSVEVQGDVAHHLANCEMCRVLASAGSASEDGGLLADRYRLEQCIGEGSAGSVWAAEDTSSGERVAIKILREATVEAKARLVRELAAGRNVTHRAVLSARGIVSDGDEIALVSQLLDGETLRERLGRGRMSQEETTQLLGEIADGLAACHDAGIVHRDLKPANVFLDMTGPKIIDLGLAKVRDEMLTASIRAFRTRKGSTIGTPLYMAPECVRAEAEPGPRTDVWSLGVILYECLSGVRPYEAKNLATLLLKLDAGDRVALSHRVRDVSDALESLLDAMLSQQPEERPTAREVAAALFRM